MKQEDIDILNKYRESTNVDKDIVIRAALKYIDYLHHLMK
jgi:hypothetical protein